MWHDVRFAVRVLRKNPGFTLLALTALALGIGANCAIFTVVHAVLIAPLPYADPTHLYEISGVDNRPGASLADFEAMHLNSFSQLSVDRFWSVTLIDHSGDAERIYRRALSQDTLPLLGVTPIFGRIFSADDYRPSAPRVALISEKLWKRRYSADPQIAGKIVDLDGENTVILGVLHGDFNFPIPAYDIWTPWIFSQAELANRKDHGITIFARLKPGVTVAQAQSELDAFSHNIAAQFPDTEKNWHPRLGPTKLGSRDQYRTQLLVLLGAVGFVLLISCLNVANLLLARAAGRRREIAVRIALGAERWRIVRQLLTESLLLAVLGALLGILLASWGTRALIVGFPGGLSKPSLEHAGLNATVLGFTLAISLISGILFGLAPALQISRVRVWQSGLVVAETAISLVLLIGAGLMVRSFGKLLEVQPGFRPEHVLTVQVPMPSFLTAITTFASRKEIESRQAAEYGDLIDHIRALPDVIAAGAATVLPLGPVDVHTQVGFEGDPNPSQDHGASLASVSPDYFRAMGIVTVGGRVFTENDTGNSPDVAIVNDIIARRYWPNENPIGKKVNMSGLPQGPWYEVVGVVGATRQRNLSAAPQPEIYRPYKQYLGPAFGALLAVRTTRDPSSLAPAIRQQIRTLYPNQPIGDVKLMTDVVASSLSLARFYTSLLTAFAILAAILAAAGIYGVMSYSVEQRTREIGVRMAIGASGTNVAALILRQGMMWVVAGVVIGIGGAVGLTRLIRAQLYETTPTDPGTFALVSLLLVVVAAAAGYFPALRAARVDPAVTLRHE